jgi:hypothetical protein
MAGHEKMLRGVQLFERIEGAQQFLGCERAFRRMSRLG